jgi:hypothetical protein
MSNFDRHATINGGWIAAFAIGAIMMAAPAYWEFSRQTAGIVFWGGVAILLCSVLAVILDWASEKGARKRVSGPFLVMALGIFIVCAGAAWHFWPNSDPEQTNDKIQGALPGPLAGLTNAQLRERAISFVQTLRDFENTFDKEERRLGDDQWVASSQPSIDQEERQKQFRLYSQSLINRRAAHVFEFKSKYRADAVIIREEIQRRLGGRLPEFPSTSHEGMITSTLGRQIFESPLLTGPHPISAGGNCSRPV